MKAIQVMIDPELLSHLDATDEVRREGRSAVLRRAVSEYLDRRRRRQISEEYLRAYRTDATFAGEFERWDEQGSWSGD